MNIQQAPVLSHGEIPLPLGPRVHPYGRQVLRTRVAEDVLDQARVGVLLLHDVALRDGLQQS